MPRVELADVHDDAQQVVRTRPLELLTPVRNVAAVLSLCRRAVRVRKHVKLQREPHRRVDFARRAITPALFEFKSLFQKSA